MLFGLASLVGCAEREAAAPAAPSPVPVLFVEVAARVGEAGEPGSWSARASFAAPEEEPLLAPGECRPARSARASEPRGERGVDAIAMRGATSARLAWDGERGAWAADGPRETLDPAWSVSDVVWSDGAREHVAEGAIRFAGVPSIERVARAREGEVTLSWNPDTVHEANVLVLGPGGLLRCGVADGSVTLPWWAVPAVGGEVVLRTRREESEVVEGVLVRVRTILERVVPLDQPEGTTAEEEAPQFEPYTPHGPRRAPRKARSSFG